VYEEKGVGGVSIGILAEDKAKGSRSSKRLGGTSRMGAVAKESNDVLGSGGKPETRAWKVWCGIQI